MRRPDLAAKASHYSEDVAIVGLVLGLAAAAYYVAVPRQPHHHHPHAAHQGVHHAAHSAGKPLDIIEPPKPREEVLQQK